MTPLNFIEADRGYETPCWIWQQAKNHGYGVKHHEGRLQPAHRISYEEHKGPIPPGLQIDHLCRNRDCINPDHLEPVTQQENLRRGEGAAAQNARKTHCIRGHKFTEENTYVRPGGKGRVCRRCRIENRSDIRPENRGTRPKRSVLS